MSFGGLLAWVFALGWLPMHFFRAEAVRDAIPFYERGERPWVWASVAVMTLHVSLACVMLSVRPSPPVGRSVVGLMLFAAAVGFWLWARSLIGPLRTPRIPTQPPGQFRRHGPYGLVRHPLYFSMLIAAGAPVVVSPSPLLVITFLLCVFVMIVRAVQEEGRLRVQVGAPYEVYCREVKRLIPFVW